MSAGVFWNQDFNKKPLKPARKHHICVPADPLGTLSYSNITNGGSFIETNKWAPGVCASCKTWMLDVTGLNLCSETHRDSLPLGISDKFKPEPTQNITVGSKKTQPGQSAAGSANDGPHRLQTHKENKDEPTSLTANL